MNAIYAFTIIFIVYAVGDSIATKTKGIISMMLFAFVVFLIGFWTVLPDTFFEDSGFLLISGALVGLLMVHIGTTINIVDFFKQWKTVIIAFLACAATAFGTVFIGQLFVERGYALVAGPISSGAIVATLIMQEAAEAIGRTDLVVFATIKLVSQNLIGIPIASLALKSEAKRLLANYSSNSELTEEANIDSKTENKSRSLKFIPSIPDKYLSNNMIVAKLAIVMSLSTWISNLTNGSLNSLVVCLILGILFTEIGFLEKNSINKANGAVFVMAAAPIAAFQGLRNATPNMFLEQMTPLVIVTLVGVVCLVVVAVVVGKLLNVSWQMSIALGVSCLFGFPSTLIVASEAARSVTDNSEEIKYLEGKMQPSMIIAGVVSVSISSVIFASIVASWL
ncbi:hypothetical protein [Fundicoccus culcitae]|uniref:Permease n=1 Tax=Fundicoccus culcitae TaxID=2969821 RepID=A0ABY5P7P5_9LACT|nr:hypothetical protein [Fundicoccus culcitae]UUX34757.1 hypothetical protein NRE15_03665 [Fundicoccus culcitae]